MPIPVRTICPRLVSVMEHPPDIKSAVKLLCTAFIVSLVSLLCMRDNYSFHFLLLCLSLARHKSPDPGDGQLDSCCLTLNLGQEILDSCCNSYLWALTLFHLVLCLIFSEKTKRSGLVMTKEDDRPCPDVQVCPEGQDCLTGSQGQLNKAGLSFSGVGNHLVDLSDVIASRGRVYPPGDWGLPGRSW
ncbi:hypothetical protein RRG08_025611 [Elysia crispata]|uniref:Uncharacterized protein n=1 Tax=Elysia crispata TaxID=231223 RepID=A0AAE0YE07_9GAST|nr:hypothetical protein RRG08_025611 [Elysia crispata]